MFTVKPHYSPEKLYSFFHLMLEFIENNQDLQNDVLTSYHLMTLIFEMTPSLKFIASD